MSDNMINTCAIDTKECQVEIEEDYFSEGEGETFDALDCHETAIKEETPLDHETVEEEIYMNNSDMCAFEILNAIEQENIEEREKAELEAWWEANKNIVRVVRKPEIAKEDVEQEFRAFEAQLKKDRELKQQKDEEMRKWKIGQICEWYTVNIETTKISVDMSLEEQWKVYCAESQKAKLAVSLPRPFEQLITRQKLRRAHHWRKNAYKGEPVKEVRGKKEKIELVTRSFRNVNRPNAKGCEQGLKAKLALKQAKIDAQKAKAAGETSTYEGKRAKRRAIAEKKTIVVIPRESVVVPQFDIPEPSDDEEEEEVVPIQMPSISAMEETKKIVEEKKVVEENEEENDEDFAKAIMSARGIVCEKPIVKIPAPVKPVALEPGIHRVGKKLVMDLSVQKPIVPKPSVCEKPAQQENVKTVMCKSVAEGRKCTYGSKCRFAHSFDEMRKSPCKFGDECMFVCCVGESVYKNKGSQKVCAYWHCEESAESYAARLGLKISVSKPVQPPVRPSPPVKPPTPPPARSTPTNMWNAPPSIKPVAPTPAPLPVKPVAPTPVPLPASTPLPVKPVVPASTPLPVQTPIAPTPVPLPSFEHRILSPFARPPIPSVPTQERKTRWSDSPTRLGVALPITPEPSRASNQEKKDSPVVTKTRWGPPVAPPVIVVRIPMASIGLSSQIVSQMAKSGIPFRVEFV